VLQVPAAFEEAVRNAIAGVCCLGCHAPHLLLPRTEPRQPAEKAR
jgi:hypothetical protein